jgi:hypothetical protein
MVSIYNNIQKPIGKFGVTLGVSGKHAIPTNPYKD